MQYEKVRELAGLSHHQKLRQVAINKYYENPNRCLHCEKVIPIPMGGRSWDAKQKKFCDRSCSASYNNKGVRRHPESDKTKTVCPDCNGQKSVGATTCHNCKKIRTWNQHKLRTLSDVACKGNARVRWAQVRTWASKILKLVGRDQKCRFCEEACVLDVCHLKPISEFSEDTLCGVVNHPSNLEYMCPTHHKYFDKGWIDLEGNTTEKCPCTSG